MLPTEGVIGFEWRGGKKKRGGGGEEIVLFPR